MEESSSRDAIQPRAAFDHKDKPSSVDSDDEDEEVTMLSSEFNTVASDQITSQSAKEKHSVADAKEEDIDDLMHAVKKSRSKKKKKKKKNL